MRLSLVFLTTSAIRILRSPIMRARWQRTMAIPLVVYSDYSQRAYHRFYTDVIFCNLKSNFVGLTVLLEPSVLTNFLLFTMIVIGTELPVRLDLALHYNCVRFEVIKIILSSVTVYRFSLTPIKV